VGIDGTAYFRANDDATGQELWRSRGTSASTKLVKDLDPDAGDSLPLNFTRVRDVLFFSADTPGSGRELWKHVR
jgi:ELWxxDGT repeat protein